MLARLRSRAQEEKGFTLIELLVVVLIIGILAAIAIPAFLGQKKGAQDANAKSLLRNAAIAMESFYSENQDFDSNLTTPSTLADDLLLIEPNIKWQVTAPGTGTEAKRDEVLVTTSAYSSTPTNRYFLMTKSASATYFAYYRNEDAQTSKCKGTAAPTDFGTTAKEVKCTPSQW